MRSTEPEPTHAGQRTEPGRPPSSRPRFNSWVTGQGSYNVTLNKSEVCVVDTPKARLRTLLVGLGVSLSAVAVDAGDRAAHGHWLG